MTKKEKDAAIGKVLVTFAGLSPKEARAVAFEAIRRHDGISGQTVGVPTVASLSSEAREVIASDARAVAEDDVEDNHDADGPDERAEAGLDLAHDVLRFLGEEA